VSQSHTPRRIVSLQPSASVILRELGQLDRLIACTRYCVDVCPEVASGRIIVQDSWTARSQEIINAHPDLVIAAVPYQEKAVTEILKAGARFLGLAPKTLSDIYTDIASIAGILGVPERGEQVIAGMQREIEKIRTRAARLPSRRVFCEEWGKPLIASQTWVAELVQTLGAEFVGIPGRETTPEFIAAEDPDVLIAAWCGAGDRVPLEKIVQTRGWMKLRAVQQRRVYCVRDEMLNTPAPTLILGLQALAAAIHPQEFPQAPGLRCITDVTREARSAAPPRL
jgi:iron complex transport system substrate-binding protein